MDQVVLFRNNLFRISEPFITDQAQQLRRHAPLYLGRRCHGPAPAGARVHTLVDDRRPGSMPRIGWQMLTRGPAPYLRLLAPYRPALVHAHFGTDGVYALPVARGLGVPLITTFHGFDATLSTAALLGSPAWMNYPLFRRRLARQGALFLCVSEFIRARVLRMGFPPARTLLHYTGVDCTRITQRDPAEETGTIVHVGRLVEMKGTAYLLRAFALLAARHPATDLVIIGDGALRPGLQALAGTLGIAARVRFLGALPHAQTLAWIRAAAMLVLPSVQTATGRVEGLGMVLLEAAASAVPVVGSRVGGIPEVVADGQTGLLVPPRDPPALAAAIGTLLEDPALRLRMGRQARMRVERDFCLIRQGAVLEGLYDSVAHARNSGADFPVTGRHANPWA